MVLNYWSRCHCFFFSSDIICLFFSHVRPHCFPVLLKVTSVEVPILCQPNGGTQIGCPLTPMVWILGHSWKEKQLLWFLRSIYYISTPQSTGSECCLHDVFPGPCSDIAQYHWQWLTTVWHCRVEHWPKFLSFAWPVGQHQRCICWPSVLVSWWGIWSRSKYFPHPSHISDIWKQIDCILEALNWRSLVT